MQTRTLGQSKKIDYKFKKLIDKSFCGLFLSVNDNVSKE